MYLNCSRLFRGWTAVVERERVREGSGGGRERKKGRSNEGVMRRSYSKFQYYWIEHPLRRGTYYGILPIMPVFPLGIGNHKHIPLCATVSSQCLRQHCLALNSFSWRRGDLCVSLLFPGSIPNVCECPIRVVKQKQGLSESNPVDYRGHRFFFSGLQMKSSSSAKNIKILLSSQMYDWGWSYPGMVGHSEVRDNTACRIFLK